MLREAKFLVTVRLKHLALQVAKKLPCVITHCKISQLIVMSYNVL